MHGSGSLGMFEQPDKLICVGNRNYLLEAEFTDGRLRGLVINNKENSLSSGAHNGDQNMPEGHL